MKKEKKGNFIEVELTVKGKEWTDQIKKAENETVKNFSMKGFRKGQVPSETALSHTPRPQIWEMAVNNLLQASETIYKSFEEVSKEGKIIKQPDISIAKVTEELVTLKISFLILPETKLGDYKTIKVKREVSKFDEERFNNEIKSFMRHVSETESVKEGTVKKGDTISIDFEGFVDNKPFPGGEANDYKLELGSNSFIPGFEDQLVGKKVGSNIDVKVTFPKDYHSKDVAGKPSVFKVKINSLEKEKKQTDEEINKKLSGFGFKDKEALKDQLRSMMDEDNQEKANAKFRKDIIDGIKKLKGTEISIPKELIDQEVEMQLQNLKSRVQQQNQKFDDYLKQMRKTEVELKESFAPEAKERIEIALIFGVIAKDNKIEVTDKDLEIALEKEAKKQRMEVEMIKGMINIESFKTNIVYDKVLEFLANKSK